MVFSRSRERTKSVGLVDFADSKPLDDDDAKVEAPIDRTEAPSPAEAAEASSSSSPPPPGPSAGTRATQTPVIEPGTESDDEFDLDSGLQGDDTTASLASSIYTSFAYERGRRYQTFGDGQYPIPNDDLEQNREDMKHAMYPSAHVCGIDLTPIQPEWVPANVSFLVDDCTLDWIERDVDLAHFRFMVMILKDIPTVLGHAYEYVIWCRSTLPAAGHGFVIDSHSRSLRPGGWVELQELQGVPLCDDGTMSDEDPVKSLYDTAGAAYKKFGLSTTLPAELEPYLREAGFENVHCRIMKVPIGTWAKGKIMRAIGLYQKMAILDFIPTLAGRPFQALQISEADAEIRVALARKGLEDTSVHRYFNYYFWYAQKPGSLRRDEDDV
ncbi:hypothetical protein MAC_01540 [Metarhizium acridum CQMa 102]|uniref:Methyltransferase domain-containing protein n=1 Tax=Metarhizium acridum (strain CQMa 102) TaxID=655827 RepID=E9DV92_METAQ|nr:uncharacterized protein MAC_01540 [Metarhizium acridum CQMa 102]EFY92269.1 hypothetical protein MAC_01540 [Metarhizium acridum CQMa 102]